MRVEFRKIDWKDVASGYRLFVDGVYVTSVTSCEAEHAADGVIVGQIASEGYEFEHGADDWRRAFELDCQP